jgi:hypothetical protein
VIGLEKWASYDGVFGHSSIPAARRLKSTVWATVINRWHWTAVMGFCVELDVTDGIGVTM